MAAETLAVVRTLQPMLSELVSKVRSMEEKRKTGSASADAQQPDAGLDFLGVKAELLLSYCIDVTYYLLMKVEGRKVRDHPVLRQLLTIRSVIERVGGWAWVSGCVRRCRHARAGVDV